MGTTVYWMNTSVDLLIEQSPDDHTGKEGTGFWIRIDEELHRAFNERGRAHALMIEGRVVYEMMESYWPPAVHDESLPEFLREWAQIWTEMPKVLVSNTRTRAEHNTRIVGGPDALDQIAQIRSDTEGVIGVGGATLATQLLRRGLLDEIVLYTHPAILGSGRPLFDALEEPLILDLLEQERFASGVTMHHYAIRRSLPS
jgi:dihydrofolate reductase